MRKNIHEQLNDYLALCPSYKHSSATITFLLQRIEILYKEVERLHKITKLSGVHFEEADDAHL